MKPLAQNTMIQNRYLIVHLIGKGGMGEVYLAVDQRLGSAVALKRTYFAGDEMLGNAFEREARILARMRHPVLPKVSDHFSENDEQYLVMEHISGDDLAKRLELARKPFPLTWVMFWADQLLDALSYLHSHEPPIIHRDIKPQNLKLTDENHIILLDFGLSKSSTGQTQLTNSGGSTGSVVGYTPHYAPMEQIRGIGTNPRSDIYSLSATLYQLLTNQVPGDALTRADTMLNGMPDPIQPLHELNPEVPRTVSDVILKGMEVSQDKRFGSAREMQKALRKAFNQMQEAMSAQTVAFNLQGEGVQNLQTSVQAPIPGSSVPQPGKLDSVPGAESESSPDNSADSSFSGGLRQADVKTEVFLAGDPAFALPDTPVENFPPPQAQSLDSFSGRADAPEESFSPEATVPLISLEKESAGNGAPVESYSSGSSYDPDRFATVAAGNGISEPKSAVDNSQVSTPVPQKARSGSKVFAILGGLVALFVLAVGAGGAGWYIYSNYYAAGASAEPSPSPEASIEPSPEPTMETVFGSDTNTNAESADSNTNTSNEDLTVAPTPAAEPEREAEQQVDQPVTQQQPVERRPTPNVTRGTPNRPAATPAPRTAPQPKRDDRTRILQ